MEVVWELLFEQGDAISFNLLLHLTLAHRRILVYHACIHVYNGLQLRKSLVSNSDAVK